MSFGSVNGFFVANKENDVAKCGWVNKHGKKIIPCKYDRVSYADSHLLWCNLFGKNALFNDNGSQLSDFVYEEVEAFHNGYAIAKKATGYGILSSFGKEITDFKCESIDEFFVGHQFRDYDVYDVDSGDEGEAVYSLNAEIEGPFRYGIASLHYGQDKEEQSFIDISGNTISLHALGECALASVTHSATTSTKETVLPNNYFDKVKTAEHYTRVSGVTYGDRQHYIPRLKEGDELGLFREHDNQYDNNALAVHDANGHHLGYVPKELAAKISPIIDQGKHFCAFVASITGGNGLSYGLNIRICEEL